MMLVRSHIYYDNNKNNNKIIIIIIIVTVTKKLFSRLNKERKQIMVLW
jgi:hypothetical protein